MVVVTFNPSLGPGRVFFSHDKGLELDWVAFQPLENHVENVRKLLSCWNTDKTGFDLALDPEQRAYLYKHSRFHDWGKTARFSIKQVGKGWSYSFKGHRFLNPETLQEEPYALALERAHHDYSVQEIVKDTYKLAKNPDPEVKRRAERYPKDLFVLEMCDQIEAEIAVTVIKGSARNTSFMEFEVAPSEFVEPLEEYLPYGKEVELTLDPYPFEEDAVTLEIAVRRHPLQSKSKAADLKMLGFYPYDAESLDVVKVTLRGKENARSAKEPSIENFYARASADPSRPDSGFSPNELQREVWKAWEVSSLPGLIVKAPTGVGKTEACVYPPLAHNKRVLMVLPAKALVDDHKRRFKQVFECLSESDKRQRRLLIDTGDTAELYTFPSNGKKPDTDHRHLYRADLIITTLDKFIYRFFGYGGARKSYVYPLRINDKQRMAFVFDEAHSYEGTAFTNFQRLVTTLYDNEHAITLMTATLPKDYQKALQDPESHGFMGRWEVIDYLEEKRLELSKQKGPYHEQRYLRYLPDAEVFNPEVPDPDDSESFASAKGAFETHKAERVKRVLEQVHISMQDKGRLIVTLDRVADAAEVYERLREEGLPTLYDSDNPQLFLYHGRLDKNWRSDVYARVKELDDSKAGKPYTLVSTSAIEIGVDLDAQALITEICNPDALVQRMGRCNRRGYEKNARVTVVGSHIPAYLDAFGENRSASENYLELLLQHHNNLIDGGFSNEVMSKYEKPVLHDPRASTAFSMLYKYVYDHALEYANLHELGFIATRSWDPAIEVRIPMGDGTFHGIQIPVSRLSRSTDDAKNVLLERFNFVPDRDKNTRGDWEPVTRGGDLYRGTYRITLLEDSELCQRYRERPDLGLVDLPQVFQRQRWKSDPPLMVRLNTWLYAKSEDSQGVFYIAQDDKNGKRLVFSYLADPNLAEE